MKVRSHLLDDALKEKSTSFCGLKYIHIYIYLYIYIYTHRFVRLNPLFVLGFHLRMHDQCLHSAFQHVLDWEAWFQRRRCQDWNGPKRVVY